MKIANREDIETLKSESINLQIANKALADMENSLKDELKTKISIENRCLALIGGTVTLVVGVSSVISNNKSFDLDVSSNIALIVPALYLFCVIAILAGLTCWFLALRPNVSEQAGLATKRN